MAKQEDIGKIVTIVLEIDVHESVVSDFAEHIRAAADDMRAKGESCPLSTQDPNTQRYNLLYAARRLRASVKGL